MAEFTGEGPTGRDSLRATGRLEGIPPRWALGMHWKGHQGCAPLRPGLSNLAPFGAVHAAPDRSELGARRSVAAELRAIQVCSLRLHLAAFRAARLGVRGACAMIGFFQKSMRLGHDFCSFVNYFK